MERLAKPARLFAAALMCAVGITQTAGAQGSISAGQTVSGRLDGSDYLRDDGTYYDDWFYEGRAGERITVTQASGDFDSWLLLGSVTNGEFALAEFDDDGAGGNDSRITYTLPAEGRYVIRVNVVGRGRTGAYTLRVERVGGGGGAGSSPAGIRTLTAGQTFTGELDPSDPVWQDNTFYELWGYNGNAGERLTITMRSPAFNSYMQYGRMSGGEFTYLGGSTSRTVGGQHETVIELTLPSSGEYGIRANSHGRHTGQYVISVSSSGGAVSSTKAPSTPLSLGSTIRGTLTSSDMQSDSGWYHDDYTISGSRGDVIYLDMVASDFDAYIDIYDGSTWVASDDDGGESLNARLAFTLPGTGSYTVCARSRYANRTGSYTLSVR